ncbi:hypothetical protein Taro_032247 [Colocasia esculenta]|uniref:Uncharacterized protein n=1 Tax=Colocasia esculenta TaxID=4460 RepID=A0A843W8W0_COLES|nr:hypothetical protein [Colocasia esculenta]
MVWLYVFVLLPHFPLLLAWWIFFSWCIKEEVALGSLTTFGALELGGGGVLAYEKAHLWWIFIFSTTLVSSSSARHLRACPRDRLLPLPGTPSPACLLEGVLRTAGETSQQLPPRQTEETGPQ